MRRLFALVLLLILTFCACGQEQSLSPKELLLRLSASCPLGAGVILDSEAAESDAEYLDPLLFRALYARADGSDDSEDICAAALFLGDSAVSHREIGIFSCRGSDSVREVAALCRARAALITEETGGTPRVLIYGTTVILLALPDSASAIRLLDRLLG